MRPASNRQSVDIVLPISGPGLQAIRNYSGPEVGFEEIAADLLQARFWIASEPTNRQVDSGAASHDDARLTADS